MYYVYILENLREGRFYIGSTEEVPKRLFRHNSGQIRSTKAYRPWQVIHTESYKTRQEACRRELQIKSYKGGEAFKRLIRKD